MGTWFLSGSIDVVAEREAALLRDRFACGMLFSRLADALIAPDETLKDDAIAAAPHLGFADRMMRPWCTDWSDIRKSRRS